VRIVEVGIAAERGEAAAVHTGLLVLQVVEGEVAVVVHRDLVGHEWGVVEATVFLVSEAEGVVLTYHHAQGTGYFQPVPGRDPGGGEEQAVAVVSRSTADPVSASVAAAL
jgi:hypothetical protein